MTRIFDFSFMNRNLNNQNTSKEICETLKKTIENSPVAKFALGVVPLPLVMGMQLAAGKAFELAGHHTLSYETSKNFFSMKVSSLSEKKLINFVDESSIADPIFYGEFIQNYLLEGQLSKLLRKVSPDHVDFLKTTKGKISRIFATSLVAFGISLGWAYSYNFYRKSTADILANAVNRFILVAFFGSLREITNSNLTGIGLNYFKLL